jgi:hypothetical protein
MNIKIIVKSILSFFIRFEKYKEIKNFEGLYIISNKGRIFRQLNNGIFRELKWMKKPNGYYKVELYKKGKRKDLYIHRLVAEHFIPNDDPVNKDEVNHKKRNKKNNSVTNLIWVTRQENMEHYHKDRKKKTTIQAITELKKAWQKTGKSICKKVNEIKNNIKKSFDKDWILYLYYIKVIKKYCIYIHHECPKCHYGTMLIQNLFYIKGIYANKYKYQIVTKCPVCDTSEINVLTFLPEIKHDNKRS